MIAASTLALINQLIYATEPKEQASLQPLDLNTTNFVVSTLLYISEAFNITVDEVYSLCHAVLKYVHQTSV